VSILFLSRRLGAICESKNWFFDANKRGGGLIWNEWRRRQQQQHSLHPSHPHLHMPASHQCQRCSLCGFYSCADAVALCAPVHVDVDYLPYHRKDCWWVDGPGIHPGVGHSRDGYKQKRRSAGVAWNRLSADAHWPLVPRWPWLGCF